MRRPREKLGQSAREAHIHDGWSIAVDVHIVHTQRLAAILDRGHQGRDHTVVYCTPVSVEFILHPGGVKSFSEIDWELTLHIIVGKVWAKPPLSTRLDIETFRRKHGLHGSVRIFSHAGEREERFSFRKGLRSGFGFVWCDTRTKYNNSEFQGYPFVRIPPQYTTIKDI